MQLLDRRAFAGLLLFDELLQEPMGEHLVLHLWIHFSGLPAVGRGNRQVLPVDREGCRMLSTVERDVYRVTDHAGPLPCCSEKPTRAMRSSPQGHRDQQRQEDQGGSQQGYVLDLHETTGDGHDRLLRFEAAPHISPAA
jgi:hypothetical protein